MTPNITPTADGGYIRVPRAYLDLDVSPGAKVVLLHLCASANDDGESWHSYENIGRMLGRSKGSVTAYVRELVTLGLVKAKEQRMANGYNYRRRLCLLQWRSLVSHWKNLTNNKKSIKNKSLKGVTEAAEAEYSVTKGSPETSSKAQFSGRGDAALVSESENLSSQQTERSDQPAECKEPSVPNKINKNKTTATLVPVVWSQNDEIEWRKFRPCDRDPVGTANGTPGAHLVEKLEMVQAQIEASTNILDPNDGKLLAYDLFSEFCRTKGIKAPHEGLNEAAQGLSSIALTPEAQQAAITGLSALWKPHWRKLPTKKQIEDSLKEIAANAMPDKNLLSTLSQTKHRLWIAGIHLKEKQRTPH